MELPALETERLIIRPFMRDDLDGVYRMIDCDCFGSRSVEDQGARQRRGDWLEWNILGYKQQACLGHPPYGDRAITLKTDGRLVGVCGLVPAYGPFRRLLDGEPSEANSPELGLFYAIAGEFRRRGYATEAAAALIEFAFRTLRVGRIIATTEPENTASLGVMRRLGMAIHQNAKAGWPEIVGCRHTPPAEG